MTTSDLDGLARQLARAVALGLLNPVLAAVLLTRAVRGGAA